MRRIVLLGASNLTLAFPHVVGYAAADLGPRPLRVLAAAGHGRAYAVASRVLGRRLPAIAACGLWRHLECQPGVQTRALVADVGNDLAYGAGVDETLEAVGHCLERLRAAGAETILVLPPLAGIEQLSRSRFMVIRSLLFPGRTFDHQTIIRRLRLLSTELGRLAEAVGARITRPDSEWLGGDGIHIRWRRRRAAWRSLLAGWCSDSRPADPAVGVRWSWLRAERSRLMAVPLHRVQPSKRLADGSTLACY